MTPEEAKYYFQQLMNRMEGINLYKPEGGIALGAKEQLFGVIDMALEKQIPKKPLPAKKPMSKVNVRCPECGRTFYVVEVVVALNYCPDCGQRILWEVKNDEA